MAEDYRVHCSKMWDLDIAIVGEELKFKRTFEGEGPNICEDHTKSTKSIYLRKSCMDCDNLIAEAQ